VRYVIPLSLPEPRKLTSRSQIRNLEIVIAHEQSKEMMKALRQGIKKNRFTLQVTDPYKVQSYSSMNE
jgi:hypothetical protein